MRKEYQALAGILAFVIVGAGLILLIPQTQYLDTVGSRELDENLYMRLDEYLQSYEENPTLADIFAIAMKDPTALSEADRQIILAQERDFLAGWELAWTYRLDGRLETDRYVEWDTWYAVELERRPSFVWTDNRMHFPEAFVQHVENSVQFR